MNIKNFVSSKIILLVTILTISASAKAQFFIGGNMGASTDNYGNYFEIAPEFGYRLSPLTVGVAPFMYYWSANERTSYGGRVFSRLNVVSGLYALAEFQATKNVIDGIKQDWVYVFPVGLGYSQYISDHVSVSASLIYNLLQDPDCESPNPYYRAGINYDF